MFLLEGKKADIVVRSNTLNMPIPPIIFSQIMQMVVRLAPLAYRAGKLIQRKSIIRVGDYAINIVRRLTLGADGAISQMVHISKSGKVQEIWHMVVKNGKIIHKNIK